MRPRDVFTAVPKTQSWRPYKDPVVTVSPSGKGQLSITAEELLGTPDEIVLLSDGNGSWALRTPIKADPQDLRRQLDPNRGIHLGITPGHYILEPEGDIYRLERCDSSKLARKVVRRENAVPSRQAAD